MGSVVDLDRRAVEVSAGIAARITPGQLTWPTPCAGWNLADLLSHMIAQHYGFAAAAEGNGADPSAWQVHPVAADASSAYAAAARRVIAAFAADDVLERSFWLPEIRGGIRLRARTAIGFHLVDYVVHGWDVAATLGVQADYPPDVVAAALAIAEQVPDDASRLAAGSAFQPARPVPAGETPMRRMLLLLGRPPSWPS